MRKCSTRVLAAILDFHFPASSAVVKRGFLLKRIFGEEKSDPFG
jgi:hypothetical protein